MRIDTVSVMKSIIRRTYLIILQTITLNTTPNLQMTMLHIYFIIFLGIPTTTTIPISKRRKTAFVLLSETNARK
uniref:Uncharacterized protein n=1 Tax=Bombyx mori TaxID=7091 RepID=A0A8R2M7N4_BOMMO|nr:uncharacterized protein LOC101745787 [Bombyx mori]